MPRHLVLSTGLLDAKKDDLFGCFCIQPSQVLHLRLALMFFSPKLDMVTQHNITEQLQGYEGETQPPSPVPAALVADKG